MLFFIDESGHDHGDGLMKFWQQWRWRKRIYGI